MDANLLHNYRQIIQALNIPVNMFGTDYSNISRVDHELRQRIAPQQGYVRFKEVFERKSSSDEILRVRDSFRLNYYFFNAPDFSEDGKKFICIGPLIREELTDDEISRIMKTHRLPQTIYKDMLSFYNNITVYENLAGLERVLILITSALFQRPVDIGVLPEKVLEIELPGSSPSKVSLQISDTVESMYLLENQMMDAVSIGDAETAKRLFRMQEQLTFRPRYTANPLRYAKNRFIVFNVLLRKAIEKGGVHPIFIDQISASFSHKIETCTSETELNRTFPENMINDYCDLVKKQTGRSYHPLIQNCILYIQQHYAENTGLSELAVANFVSRQYLSTLFKKETGKTLTAYIQECQMQHAAELLSDSSYPVTKVAGMCGYDNTAYFTKIFRKYYGVTPSQYRKSPEKT